MHKLLWWHYPRTPRVPKQTHSLNSCQACFHSSCYLCIYRQYTILFSSSWEKRNQGQRKAWGWWAWQTGHTGCHGLSIIPVSIPHLQAFHGSSYNLQSSVARTNFWSSFTCGSMEKPYLEKSYSCKVGSQPANILELWVHLSILAANCLFSQYRQPQHHMASRFYSLWYHKLQCN